jgi:GWxTD domain-containing protein
MRLSWLKNLSRNRLRGATVGCLVLAGFSAAPFAVSAPLEASSAPAFQMPRDPQEAMAFYEGDVDAWVDGPVQYLMLREESELWRSLSSDAERQRFIDWFWARRDPDTRDDVNPFQAGFYERVATANQRFPGFPRGWRSDRGRVWIILGSPDNISTDIATELTVWTYYTVGTGLGFASTMGEMHIIFEQINVTTYEIYGGIGPGIWPPYVLQAFDYVNRAVVTSGDPHLEFK